eukprot:g64125.t1
MQVEEGKIVSALCVTVWEAKWCKEKFNKDASKVRAVGTSPRRMAHKAIYDYLLRVENPADVKVGTFIFDDPATRRLYGVQDENRETKTPLRKSVNFKTNEARIQLILATASLGKDAKIIQVADMLKAMYPSTSLDALIRDHFAASGYSHLEARWPTRQDLWQQPWFKDMWRGKPSLREQRAASKRQKGEQGKATATLRNRLEELDENQHETGSTGLRTALAQLADDEADRASLFDKYKLRGIAEVHQIKTSVLRRIMKGYGVSLMELRPAKNGAEYAHDTQKFVITPEMFQQSLRALLRITSAFFPQHREDIMDHFHEVLDYLRTHSLQSVIDWTYAVRCQVPLGVGEGGQVLATRRAHAACDQQPQPRQEVARWTETQSNERPTSMQTMGYWQLHVGQEVQVSTCVPSLQQRDPHQGNVPQEGQLAVLTIL